MGQILTFYEEAYEILKFYVKFVTKTFTIHPINLSLKSDKLILCISTLKVFARIFLDSAIENEIESIRETVFF